MEKRNTNRQREYRDDYRQHSPAWIRAQRRKRKRIIRRRIMIGGAVICIVLIAGVIRIFSGGKSHGKETESSAIEESTFQASDISVNGISLKGMTRSEAKAAIEKEYPWKVTITCNGEDALRIDPCLPETWESVKFRICYRKSTLDIKVTKNALTVNNRSIHPVPLSFRGEAVCLDGTVSRIFPLHSPE